MKYLIRVNLIIIVFFLFASCNEKITYSGKIINYNSLNLNDFEYKMDVINKIGQPNYIDPIDNKYYYFSEKTENTNFFNKKIIDRIMLVFTFNQDGSIESFSKFDLNDEKDIQYVKEQTPNELIERGLIEKIFGGVGGPTPIQN